MTPGSSSNGGSMPQKQPPANVAFSYRASPPCACAGCGRGTSAMAAAMAAVTMKRLMIFLPGGSPQGLRYIARSRPQRRRRAAVGHELERQPVVAPALSGWFRPVVEDVALVPAAARAVILGARHDEPEVALGADAAGDRLIEAGPAGAAVELRRGREERQVARGADERAVALFLVEGTRERAFRPFLEQHRIRLGRKQLAPFRLRLLERLDFRIRLLARHGAAILLQEARALS